MGGRLAVDELSGDLERWSRRSSLAFRAAARALSLAPRSVRDNIRLRRNRCVRHRGAISPNPIQRHEMIIQCEAAPLANVC